jgi:hypothetical protein
MPGSPPVFLDDQLHVNSEAQWPTSSGLQIRPADPGHASGPDWQQFQFHVCVYRQTAATSNPANLSIACRRLICRSSASSRYTCSNFRTSIRLHKSCRLQRREGAATPRHKFWRIVQSCLTHRPWDLKVTLVNCFRVAGSRYIPRCLRWLHSSALHRRFPRWN